MKNCNQLSRGDDCQSFLVFASFIRVTFLMLFVGVNPQMGDFLVGELHASDFGGPNSSGTPTIGGGGGGAGGGGGDGGGAGSGDSGGDGDNDGDDDCPKCGDSGTGGSGSNTVSNNTGECSNGTAGGPVYLYSGAEEFTYKDITINGLFQINLERKYNSRATYDSSLGYGWSFNYDRRVYEYPDGSVIMRYGCGRKDRFVFTGDAFQTPDGRLKGKLESLPAGEYVYTHLSGMKDFFDTQGLLIAKQNHQGHRLEFTYDARGKLPLTGTSSFAVDPSIPMVIAYKYRLTKIDERSVDGALTGNTLIFVYDDTTGRLSIVTANDGRQIVYNHDGTNSEKFGNLLTVNGLNGHTSTYIYDDRDVLNNLQDPHNITTITEGNAALPYVNTYDVDDRVATQTNGNTVRTFDYVVINQQTNVKTTIKDDQGLNPYDVDTEYYFDPVTEKASAFVDGLGNRYEYDYDAFQYPDKDRIFFNTGTKTAPVLVLQKSIDYTYDPEGNKTQEIVALDDIGNGVETITKSWSYNNGWLESEQVVSTESPMIFRTEYTFYLDGNNIPTNIKEIKRLKDDGVTFQTTTLFYDNKNRLSIKQLSDGHREHYLYEGVDHPFVTKIYHEIGGVESSFDSIRLDYDSKGNISDIWDANNNRTQQVYDDKSRLVKIINALNEETIHTYANDRLQLVEFGRTASDGEGQIIKLNYNANNRLENIQRKNDVGAYITQVSYTYDSEGRKLTEKDGENNVTLFEYDLVGNLSKSIDPLLKETTYKYDATNHMVSVTDAELNETKYTYDDLGRRIQVEQLGVSPSVITKSSYDAISNLVSVTDGKNQTTQYTYDTLSRKTGEIKPLTQTIQYNYDNRDRLDDVINARGQKIDYIYEPWGPVKTINYYQDEGAVTIDRAVSVQYDPTGTTDSISDTSISPGALYNYTYDALNRLDVTTVNAYPGGDITLNNDYDRFGNRNKLTFTDTSGSYEHGYTYNNLDQLSTVTFPGTQLFSNIKYYDNNTLKQMTTPSGVVSDYLYKANGPLKDIKFTDSDNTNIIDQYVYTFDNVHNIDTITDISGLHDYNYDELYRLTQATHPAGLGIPVSEDYSYDPVGNREDPTDSTLYSYDVNNRITKSPTVTSYGYDSDGNTTSKTGGEIFTFNHDNRLTNYTDSTTNASYQYDTAGRRINKTVDGVTTWYLWDGTELLAEYNSGGTQLKRYTYMPNQFTPIQMAIGSDVYDIHSDHLQTPKLLTDSGRNTVWQAHYRSFGEANLVTSEVEFNMRLPGQYFDAETALHYNYFRDYDPSIGRYVESDPLGLLVAGLNAYAYVGGNPIYWIDPFGLASIPNPNGIVPGGPWVQTDPNNPGRFDGPKNPNGGQRTMCSFVPKNSTSGPTAYWETKEPGQADKQRYNLKGEKITAAQAHGYKGPRGGGRGGGGGGGGGGGFNPFTKRTPLR